MKQISVAMQDELHQRLKKASENDKRKIADWVRVLIEKELEKRNA